MLLAIFLYLCNEIFTSRDMDFKDLVQLRRSHRKFTDEEIDADDVKMICVQV